MAMGVYLVWSYTFDSSLRCGKANVSSRLRFWWNICHNFFNWEGFHSAWAFMCIFRLFPLENVLAHISHAESLSPVSSGHMDLQTLPTWEKFCTSSAFVISSVWTFKLFWKHWPLPCQPPGWPPCQPPCPAPTSCWPPPLADYPAMSFFFVCWHSRKWWPPIRGGT